MEKKEDEKKQLSIPKYYNRDFYILGKLINVRRFELYIHRRRNSQYFFVYWVKISFGLSILGNGNAIFI